MEEVAAPRREPVQRWRAVLARAADAPVQTQREVAESWEAAIRATGLPLAWSEAATPRPRIALGAPLPVGMAAHAELMDVVLTERRPAWQVREALAAVVPDGWRIVDLYDVWLAGPPLAGRVAAADYRIVLDAGGPPAADLERAGASLMAAGRLERERARGSGTVRYDLRPLLLDVRVIDPGPPVVIGTRTRFHPELGTGRPDEVVAALAEGLGRPLEVRSIERDRLLLIEDLD